MEHLVDLWASIAAIIVLIAMSAFFASAETAMTGSSVARMTMLEKEGNWRARVVNRIRDAKEQMIGAMLLGNTLVNILASALATRVMIQMFGEAGVIYATAVMTVFLLIFAEVMPKTYAFQYADKYAMAIAPAVRGVIWLFSPVTKTVSVIVRFTFKIFGVDVTEVALGDHVEVLRGVIEMHTGPEEETNTQRVMLRSILDLADVEIGAIMTHRKTVQTINVDDPVDKIVEFVLNSSFSRIPVWRGTPDNIIGVLHAKTLLREIRTHGGDAKAIDIAATAAPPWFVPETTTLFDQLQAFRARREHFAFVVDEYGSTLGIVTLEDILEEIVGEIDDEHDARMPGVRLQPEGNYLVHGTVTLRDLNREFEWNLPDDEDYSTVAGLIIHEARRIPDIGQSFTFHGFRFDIVRRHRNQITLVRLTAPPPNAET